MSAPMRALSVLLLASAAGAASGGAAGALQALGMEHFRDTAAVTDDAARDSSFISTQPGFVEYSGPMRSVWHDEYLTAVIDRRSGGKLPIDVLDHLPRQPSAPTAAPTCRGSGGRSRSQRR